MPFDNFYIKKKKALLVDSKYSRNKQFYDLQTE